MSCETFTPYQIIVSVTSIHFMNHQSKKIISSYGLFLFFLLLLFFCDNVEFQIITFQKNKCEKNIPSSNLLYI